MSVETREKSPLLVYNQWVMTSSLDSNALLESHSFTRIVGSPKMKRRRRGGDSKMNVKLSQTQARGPCRAGPGRGQPGNRRAGSAGAPPGCSAPRAPGGGAADGSCVPVTRADSGCLSSLPAALPLAQISCSADRGAAAGSRRARGSGAAGHPSLPGPAARRPHSRRASWGGWGVPWGPRQVPWGTLRPTRPWHTLPRNRGGAAKRGPSREHTLPSRPRGSSRPEKW